MEISKCPIRRSNITATDMATILGLNPYETPKKLLEKKINPQPIESVHLRRGKLREPSVLEAFLLDMKIETTRHEGPTLVLPGHKISATPDAYVKNKRVLVEAKSVLGRNITKWYTTPPTYYLVQLMVQLLVTDYDYGMIGALEESDPETSEFRFIAWEVQRSARMEELMKEEAHRFWESVAGEETSFRVSSKIKKEAQSLLDTHTKLIYPTTIPAPTPENDDETVSKLLSLFN